MRRKLEDKNVRKLFKHGDSYAVTLPMETINEFGWQNKQKVTVKKWGNSLLVSDWEE